MENIVEQLTVDSGQLTAQKNENSRYLDRCRLPGISPIPMPLEGLAEKQLQQQLSGFTTPCSAAGLPWTEVVREQAAQAVALSIANKKLQEQLGRKALEVSLLEHELAKAQKSVAVLSAREEALERRMARVAKWRKRYREYWKRAVRCLTARQGANWHDVAVANQQALRIAVEEGARYKKTLQETTATMNRYFTDWQSAVAQVQDAQARNEELRITNEALRAAGPQKSEGSKGERETVATLRGRLRGVSETLDGEKEGRLAAELVVEELKGRLDGERKGAVLAMENQKARYESMLVDMRENHSGEMTGLRSMLAEVERQAWHGRLMVQALSLGMAETEFERVREECWALMKSGVDGQVLSAGGAIIQLPVESPAAEDVVKCSSCGEVLSKDNRRLLQSGRYNCEECWDVAMAVADAKGGAA